MIERAPNHTRPRGAAARHARHRMRERYGLDLTKQQWRAMAESIAEAIDRGEAFEESTDVARDTAIGNGTRWRAVIRIQREGGDLEVPIGFSYDGQQVVILTILPGGKEVPMRR